MRLNSPLTPFLLLGLTVLPALAHLPGPPKKGEIGRRAASTSVPDFTLTDQEGRSFRFQNLRGKVVLVTFVFTTCPDICPLLTAKLAGIQRRLEAEKRIDYFLLAITTDPEGDNPQALKAYGQRFRADFRRWAFLTGDRQALAKVWDGFQVKVKKLGPGQVQHTGLTTLVDRRGVRRVDYLGDEWDEKEVLRDIAVLSRN